MLNFFKGKTFISMCIFSVLCIILVLLNISSVGKVTIFEDISGIIITPIQSGVKRILQLGGNIPKALSDYENLKEENEKLKTELYATNKALREVDQYKIENDSLKKILSIAKENSDFEFEIASVIGVDEGGYSNIITINKGSLSGLKARDIVITAEGVVGYISKIGTTFAKVTTILDSSCEIGAIVTRTNDIGVVEGNMTLASDGLCKLSYLENGVSLNAGDSVETSGISGLFPGGLLIGRVKSLKPESHGVSQYAVIEPSVDIENLDTVFIIKNFDSSKGNGK